MALKVEARDAEPLKPYKYYCYGKRVENKEDLDFC